MTRTRAVITSRLLIVDAASAPVSNGAVLVEDGRIRAAGPRARVQKLAKGAVEIDASRNTVMPGMINLHAHLDSDCGPEFMAFITMLDEQTSVLLAADSARRTLLAGVTTVRDLGNKFAAAIAVRDAIVRGWIPGPRIVAAGKLVCMTGGHGWFLGHESDGPNEMRKAVRLNLKRGADCIKVIATGGVLSPGVEVGSSQLDEDELEVAVAEAHKAGRRVAAHAIGNAGIKNALRAGVDTIEHGCYLDDEALRLFQKTGATYVPTLCAPHFLHENLDKLPAYVVRKTTEVYEAHRESFKRALKRNIPIVTGTDAGTPFNHHAAFAVELELMVKLGMSAEHALRAATSGAAEALGLSNELGTLSAGKSADLIAVDGDPRKDIRALARVRGVMTRGIWHAA
ncbi:MAG TPA: amidohydrolase family protein [Candidatus Tumulicola sp.]|nr:amidohydrolase family protein [Candidatus Tumulicola sp.]